MLAPWNFHFKISRRNYRLPVNKLETRARLTASILFPGQPVPRVRNSRFSSLHIALWCFSEQLELLTRCFFFFPSFFLFYFFSRSDLFSKLARVFSRHLRFFSFLPPPPSLPHLPLCSSPRCLPLLSIVSYLRPTFFPSRFLLRSFIHVHPVTTDSLLFIRWPTYPIVFYLRILCARTLLSRQIDKCIKSLLASYHLGPSRFPIEPRALHTHVRSNHASFTLVKGETILEFLVQLCDSMCLPDCMQVEGKI